MSAYSQDNRMLAIATPLGKDTLLLEGFEGTEGISRLFTFELTMLSERPGITFDAIVGKSVTMYVILPSGARRFFNGIVSRFVQGAAGGLSGIDPRFSRYRATVVPWLWLLTRTADSRIFQKMSVPEIIEKIFRDQGFTDFKLTLQGSYARRDYCVQYRESDFNFVSRLMEEEGIHYFFEHANERHTLILADSPSANKPCPNQKIARFQINIGGRHDDDVISSLEKMQEIRPGKYTLNDFNFVTPNTGLTAESPTKFKLGPGEREIYEYPGMYGTKVEGDRYAGIRMEEEETQITTIVGVSECRAFTSGYRYMLESFYRKEMNSREYLLTSIQHQFHQGWATDATPEYSNRFTCIPADVPYRPARLTPKPVVQGVQTAIVVGPSGEEIHVDEHGRVKVQFHWDREGRKNENSSCWMRVSQLWAGAGWGALFIPRIGQEVIVDFLEGDPDRPIITGRVYHGINRPPYPLPAEMTKSTIKSNSSKGDGGYNELRFEDKKGSEEIYLHGQKNWTITIISNKNQSVGHDETLTVGNNRTKEVKKDQSETIGENKTISVGKSHTESITENASVDIGKNETVSVGENTSVTIGKNFTNDIGEKSDTTVGKDMSISVGKNSSTQIGDDMTIDVGKNLAIQAADSITIKTGDASITMKKDGTITIKGKDITLNGSGKISVKAKSDVVIKGSKVMSN